AAAEARRMNLRRFDERTLCIALDEMTSEGDLEELLAAFASISGAKPPALSALEAPTPPLPEPLLRRSAFLTHPVFNSHHSETEMLRYLRLLESRDLSLTHSMIPLGSCTMKLNATAEMMPVTWAAFSRLHPFAPRSQAAGYQEIFRQLEGM